MPNNRNQVQMSDAEIWDFVSQQRDMHVATIGKDGTPHLTTNWFAIVDGNVVFNSYERSQKIVNLRRDSRLSVLFSGGMRYDELIGVSITGRADLIDDTDQKIRILSEITSRNASHSGQPSNKEIVKELAQKRTCVEVQVQHIISWNHAKLGEQQVQPIDAP